MKILAICGSPRKGGTYRALQYLQDLDTTIDFEILMLKDLELKDCIGCYSCINRGSSTCPLNDDRDMILQKIDEADGVIFATPTHTRHISAIMKKFIDKLGFVAHRPRYFDKYAMCIATCKGFGADIANEYMSSNLGQFGFNVVPSVELFIATKSDKEKEHNNSVSRQAYERFIETIKSGKKTSPSISGLVYFHIFKAISVANQKQGTADFDYYQDKSDYYYDVDIPIYKKNLAKWISKKEINKMMANK